MDNGLNSKASEENARLMTASTRPPITDVTLLESGKFYPVSDLQGILKEMGLNYSIFTIRDYETWKCLNYACGRRYTEEVDKCTRVFDDGHVCNSEVRAPIIESPRTRGGGKGVGHRRYTADEIKKVIEIFTERR